MRGYYAITNAENLISNWMLCTSNNEFQFDCSAWDNVNTDTFTPNLACNMCHSSLVLDNQSCEMSWRRGSYISQSTNQNNGVYDINKWKQWSQEWFEWAGETNGYCLSWNQSNYLILTNPGEKLGEWVQKLNSAVALNLFIKASYTENNGDGTYQNPFGNIIKALSYADEQSAGYKNVTINICRLLA